MEKDKYRCMKRFLLLWVFIVIAFVSTTSMSADAAKVAYSGECGSNVKWELYNDGLLTISGEGEIEWCPYPEEYPWYSYNEWIEEIIIEPGITSIPDYAFSSDYYENDYKYLTSVTIPSSVKTIGEYAFEKCISLTDASISNGLLYIGMGAFSGCKSLKNISIPSSVTTIGEDAFLKCASLTRVNIPNGMTSIEDSIFNGCTALTKVIIPRNIKNIGAYAFYGCTSLTSISIPDSVTSIGEKAFYNTAYYNNETNWKNSVLYIGNHLIKAADRFVSDEYAVKKGTVCIADSAFSYVSSLTDIRIILPEGLVSIGASAFEEFYELSSINIPNSVTAIGKNAFSYCDGLINVYYDGTEEQLQTITGEQENIFPFSTIINYTSGESSPSTIEIIDTKIENEAVTVTVKTEHVPYCLLVGYDKEGQIVAIKRSYGGKTKISDKNALIKNIKVFSWESPHNLRPLCEAKNIVVREFNSDAPTDDISITVATPTAIKKTASGYTIIELNCSTSGADIYYTIDGTTPTVNSKKYSLPLKFTKPAIIKAMAVKSGYENSYIINISITV